MSEPVPTTDTIAGDLYAHFREGNESYDTFLSHLWRDFEAVIILIQQEVYKMPVNWYYGDDWHELSYGEKLAVYNAKGEW